MDMITNIYNLITKFIVDLLVMVGIDEERIPEFLKKDIVVA